ncbi:MAG: hypothetical protein KKB81_06355 [Candidatus Margulisbacteria bacterium]|nr:hypothetical protein [Candidatus Margulisiibacteriota bacterium]MBU1021478.1 hypothetical protein [Candidatus Margulisiibacteriota bacterium]MBU1728563.1 hypothetical protein [Candidatus Margulisiibacteriota bacterium]MBU1955858.1 hypothetical protein [Candidatus Margulisiibacteriota bacterium]
MAESGQVSSGGVHPGKPIIWPSGKSSAKQTSQVTSQEVAETGGAKANVSTAKSAASQAATQASSAQAAATTTPSAKPTAQISRPQTLQDIAALLLANNIPDTAANKNIAMQMLNRGFELSRANFLNVLSNLDGTDKGQAALDAALVMLGKDIDSAPGMKLLHQHIQNNPQMTQQLGALAQEMATTLGVIKASTSSGVTGKLAEILSEFEKQINSLADKYKFTGDGTLSREELINNLRAIKALAQGMQEQMAETQSAQTSQQNAALQSSLENIVKQTTAALENLTSQAILSKATDRADSNYVVYNVPNPNVTGEDVVIQVRRDGAGVKAEIDDKKTQVALSMGTKNLGKLHIVLSVREINDKKNVAAIFSTETNDAKEVIAENSSEFLKAMAEKECIVTSFHTVKNPDACILDYYLPKIGLDDLMKIDVEA